MTLHERDDVRGRCVPESVAIREPRTERRTMTGVDLPVAAIPAALIIGLLFLLVLVILDHWESRP
jgi:phosphotransferase system  glucose/maltose/N-acetylglucosamine-specific IIC component